MPPGLFLVVKEMGKRKKETKKEKTNESGKKCQTYPENCYHRARPR
jgi:hypothetical protein